MEEVSSLVFAFLSVLSMVVWRRYYLNNQTLSGIARLNCRTEEYIGRLITLRTRIIDGIDKI